MNANEILKNAYRIPAEVVLERLGISMINEMALSIKDYIQKIDGLRFQLVENWCLCKWCQLFNIECETFIHWVKELSTYINALKFINLKAGDKGKVLHRILVDDYDYNDPDMIFNIIRDKFKVENINDANQLKVVSKEFALNVNGLIDVISNATSSTDSYINDTFISTNEKA